MHVVLLKREILKFRDNQARELVKTAGFWSGFPRGIFFTNSVCLKPRHLLWFKTFKTVLEGVGPNSSAGAFLFSICIPGFPSPTRQERFICVDGDNVWGFKVTVPLFQLGTWDTKHLEVPACTEIRLLVRNKEKLPIKIRGRMG